MAETTENDVVRENGKIVFKKITTLIKEVNPADLERQYRSMESQREKLVENKTRMEAEIARLDIEIGKFKQLQQKAKTL